MPDSAPRPLSLAPFSLALAQDGARVRVVSVAGGAAMAQRLADLGLARGAEIDVVLRQPGRVVVGRGGMRIGLGADMTHAVMVSPSAA